MELSINNEKSKALLEAQESIVREMESLNEEENKLVIEKLREPEEARRKYISDKITTIHQNFLGLSKAFRIIEEIERKYHSEYLKELENNNPVTNLINEDIVEGDNNLSCLK